MPGLRRFDDYVYNATPHTFSGAALYAILDSFAAALQIHLTDEIVWIQSLSKYAHLDLAAIDAQHGRYVKAHSSRLRLLPYLLTNHDRTYEGGIHAWWPISNRVRDLFLRYVCTLWNRGAWKYSACSLAGKPRRLHGIRWERLDGDLTAETALVELDLEAGPKPPERAHTRVGSDAQLPPTHSPSESQFNSRSAARLV